VRHKIQAAAKRVRSDLTRLKACCLRQEARLATVPLLPGMPERLFSSGVKAVPNEAAVVACLLLASRDSPTSSAERAAPEFSLGLPRSGTAICRSAYRRFRGKFDRGVGGAVLHGHCHDVLGWRPDCRLVGVRPRFGLPTSRPTCLTEMNCFDYLVIGLWDASGAGLPGLRLIVSKGRTRASAKSGGPPSVWCPPCRQWRRRGDLPFVLPFLGSQLEQAKLARCVGSQHCHKRTTASPVRWQKVRDP